MSSTITLIIFDHGMFKTKNNRKHINTVYVLLPAAHIIMIKCNSNTYGI